MPSDHLSPLVAQEIFRLQYNSFLIAVSAIWSFVMGGERDHQEMLLLSVKPFTVVHNKATDTFWINVPSSILKYIITHTQLHNMCIWITFCDLMFQSNQQRQNLENIRNFQSSR